MSCTICLHNEIELDYITPCNHRFHKKCINVWFESLGHRDKTCPQCRSVIEAPTIIIIESENAQPMVPKNHRFIFITATTIDFIFIYYWKFTHQLILMFVIYNMAMLCLFRFGILRC